MTFTPRVRRRSQFMPPKDAVHPVRQEPASQCDINEIVRRAKSGQMPTWVNRKQPVFADVSNLPKDLTQAYLDIEAAEEAFQALPAKFRAAIDNDPRRLFTAPKELFEEHGLTLTPETEAEPLKTSSSAPKGASPSPAGPKGKGGAAAPPKGPSSGQDDSEES